MQLLVSSEVYIYIYIYVGGGKDSNFYVGHQSPFTNKNASKEQKMFEKAPQHVVVQRNVRRYQFERVILLGPEYQSSEFRLNLDNLLRKSSNEDRLQVCKEGIRTRKYLRKSCYHRIKCTTTAFLAALMWRRPLNSVFNYYRLQKTRKVTQQDKYLSAGVDNKQVDDGNGLEGTI